MGEAYRAFDPHLGREVAIKVLPEDHSDDPARLRRFEQEDPSAATLNHPSVVVVHDVGSSQRVECERPSQTKTVVQDTRRASNSSNRMVWQRNVLRLLRRSAPQPAR
jgi:serine/threonine protein kinase